MGTKPGPLGPPTIKSAVTPTIPYVAPTKKKLLLYVAQAVEKREYTQRLKTLVALLFSLVMTASRLTAAFKERFKTKLTKP